MKNIHLTSEQKATVRELATRENLRDLLILVAGIVAHDVENYVNATEAADLIRKAAIKISY